MCTESDYKCVRARVLRHLLCSLVCIDNQLANTLESTWVAVMHVIWHIRTCTCTCMQLKSGWMDLAEGGEREKGR